MEPDTRPPDVERRAAKLAERTASIKNVVAELRAKRACKSIFITTQTRTHGFQIVETVHRFSNGARLTDGSASELPRAERRQKLEDLRSIQDIRWAIVERYILSTLVDDDHDPAVRDAATKAAVEMETEGFKSGTLDSRQWNTSDDTRVHGARIRLVKLILGLREVQQDQPTTLLPDVVFLERWARASSIFEYHDRHWVRDQRKREEDEAPPVMLAFPDDGTTTMYELGKRVWMHRR
jgi:hypothetical protein